MTGRILFFLLRAGESGSGSSSESSSGSSSSSWDESQKTSASSSEVEEVEAESAPLSVIEEGDDEGVSPGSDEEAGSDEEVGSDEGVPVTPLFEYDFEVDLDWVAEEPQLEVSRYTESLSGAFREVEERGPSDELNFQVVCPSADERICSHFHGDSFAMYEYVFRELGFRLPFTSFQVSLLARLALAPSQLHPNAFAFMRAFEIVCEYLGIGATTDLFCRCFRVQRKVADGRYGWVSFKNADRKLFKMFVDSVKDFKDRYYVVRLRSRAAYTSLSKMVTVRGEDGAPERDEEGNVHTRLCSVFPFVWWKAHFSFPPKHYAREDGDLDEQDAASYLRLCQWVDSFTLSSWVSRTGEPICDEDGVPMTEARAINTRALLMCRTTAETKALLDAMPVKEDKVLKAAQDGRRIRALKNKNRGVGSGEHSGSAGSPLVIPEGGTPKRQRRSEMSREDPPVTGAERGFVLPPCFKEGQFFEKFPLSLSPDESRRVEEMSSPARLKQLASDSAAVMRVVGMAQMFAQGGAASAEVLQKAEDDKKAAEEEAARQKSLREKIKKKMEDLLKQKNEEVEEEKKKVAELEQAWEPTAEESSDVAALRSRAEFVEKIDDLKIELADMAEEGFKCAVQQLKFLNPGLKTDNIGVSSRIVDGQLIPGTPEDD
ncbi:uncharacterized protein LOC131661054 [Vicia villosa]|uniref:uncharacterized protein LOC131661054 n=1 Tax=Vicia villosa TaxID=3911 RepID=UPI00273C13A0|nr:uncharacterized protein LOC131661054 [Vicia villosa]XP_058786441.1 uncharacterized protein LOC131661054 [Vicia villosa]